MPSASHLDEAKPRSIVSGAQFNSPNY